MSGLAIGLLAAFAASGLYSLGLGLQALEARRAPAEQALRFSLLRRLAVRPLWIAGTLLGLAGWGLQALALAYAPIAVVQPALATSLVFLLAIGAWLLHERVAATEALAVIAIAAGVAGIGWAAPERSSQHASHTVLLASFAGLAAVALLPFGPGLRRRAPGLLVAACGGVAYACDGLATKLATDEWRAGSWGVFAGWLVAMGVASAVGTLSEMSALQRRPATQVAPIVLVVNTVVPVALAPVLAGESWTLSSAAKAVLSVSLVTVVAGGVALARSASVGAVLHTEASSAESATTRIPFASSRSTS